MSVEGIKIENFKCFNSIEVELGNLTVLTGENSAGKSTVIQAMLYKLQSMESEEKDKLNGKYISLGKRTEVRNCYTNGDINVEMFGTLDNRVVYLTTDRIGPQPQFQQSKDSEVGLGIHGEYAFSFLSDNRMEQIPEPKFIFDDETGMNLGNQVDFWLRYLCGYKVTAEDIEGTQVVKVSFQTDDNVKNYSAMAVGTGVTYLAVIIIAALSCTKGDVLIIENPELYLHPAAQSKFMEFFSFLSKQGLQVIIETHSDHIIHGIRKEVKRKNIEKESVKLLFVIKENNQSYINEVRLKDNGAIANPMRGFFDQIDDDLDVLLGFEDE